MLDAGVKTKTLDDSLLLHNCAREIGRFGSRGLLSRLRSRVPEPMRRAVRYSNNSQRPKCGVEAIERHRCQRDAHNSLGVKTPGVQVFWDMDDARHLLDRLNAS